MRQLAVMLLVCVFAWPASAMAQAKQQPYKIAILEFDPVTSEAEKDNLGRVTAEFLITAAVNSGSFGVVERAALKKVLDEMQFGRGSNAPGSAAQAIGAMVGAQGVLTGSVAKTAGSVRLDARLVDVASGSIVAARSAYAKSDLRSIATASELLVSQLQGDLVRLTPTEAKPASQPEARADQEQKTVQPQGPTPELSPSPRPDDKADQKTEQSQDHKPEQTPPPAAASVPAPSPDGKVTVNQ
jgi:TolB-like protein